MYVIPIIFLNNHREVVFGEHTVGEDPDCNQRGNCANKKITRNITDPSTQIFIHENFSQKRNKEYKKDIALIRLNEPVPLYSEDPAISSVGLICLPWSEHDPARSVNDTSYAVVTGWGRTKKGRESSVVHSKTLLKVKVPIADNQCRKEGIMQKNYDIDSCTTNFLNQTCQICAGGEVGKWLLVMKKPQRDRRQKIKLQMHI